MKALVTGIGGFAGSHLAEHLLAEGDEVCGITFPGEPTDNIAHILDRLRLIEVNITDGGALGKAVREAEPEVIYHLAGVASVGQSWKNMDETLRVNAVGLVNLVFSGREAGEPAILVVGSGEMYGLVEEGRQPIGEEEPLRPVNPYALSKVWQEQAARYFADVYRYPLYLTRPFNHIGPRQSWRFVCSDFAGQLARIEVGRAEPVIKVGNLSARRDFLDVRDVAAAYRLVVRAGRPGVPYNIASGRPRSIREVLDMLLGLCRAEVRVSEEAERLRPVDIPLLSGDGGRLRLETGWAPSRELKDTLADLLDFWRANVVGARSAP